MVPGPNPLAIMLQKFEEAKQRKRDMEEQEKLLAAKSDGGPKQMNAKARANKKAKRKMAAESRSRNR